jgi:protein gp37
LIFEVTVLLSALVLLSAKSPPLYANEGMLWTDRSWPVVQGCTKISPGCLRCMAEQSLGHVWGWKKNGHKEPFAVTLQPKFLGSPLRTRKPYRIFIAPTGDMFHEEVPYWFFRLVLIVTWLTPHHTYFLLTKRPAKMKRFLEQAAREGLWPLPNVNVGVSAENQKWYDKRMSILITIPVHDLAYRFVDCEPLLGPIDLGVYGHHIGWLIYGQERAVGRRAWDRAWGDSLVAQCRALHIPFYRHRSEKPEKLNIINQPKEEEAMNLKLLTTMPPDGAPSIILDRALLDQIQGFYLNGVYILFEGQAAQQPTQTAALTPVVLDRREAPPPEVRRIVACNKDDLHRLLDTDFANRTEMAEQIGLTMGTMNRLLEGESVTETTRKKVVKFLCKRLGREATFEAQIRTYPGGR